ncbi:uncharacterized protein LOC144174103 isoform X4 [Haemaphysalis longicornis]
MGLKTGPFLPPWTGLCTHQSSKEMHHDDQQLTNDLSASPDDAMESLTDNTAVGSPALGSPADDAEGVVNPAFVSGHGDEPNNLRSSRSNQQQQRQQYVAQRSLEEEKNAVNQQQNGKILNHHRIQIPEDAVINYDTARTRTKSLQQRKPATNGDVVALDVFADSAKAQEALMAAACMVANGNGNGVAGADSMVPVSSPLTSSSTAAAGDAGTKMFEEYFIPVNTHKKFLRGEKLYLTKEKRKVCSGWKRMFFCCLLLLILGIAVLVGVLAATGFLLSESKSSPKSVHVDPSGPSISASTSTLKGVPQPKETKTPPSQQSLPPSSPPIVVITPEAFPTTQATTQATTQSTDRPTTQPIRLPPVVVTDPHTTPVATTSLGEETTTPLVVDDLTTLYGTSTSSVTSTFHDFVESSATTSVPVASNVSFATTEAEQTYATDVGTTVELSVSSVDSTTAIPTTGTTPPVSSEPSTSREPAITDVPGTTTESSTAAPPLVGFPGTATEAPTTTAASTTFEASTTVSVPTTQAQPFMTESSPSSSHSEPVTSPTTAVSEGTTVTLGAPTTGSDLTEATSVTEPSSVSGLDAAMATTTTSSTEEAESSTVTYPVTATSLEERTPTGSFPVPAPNAVVGEITLPDEVFSESLNNRSSTEARNLSTQLKQGLEDILKGLGYRYETVDILKYRKGSVVASFVVVGGDVPAAKVQGAIRDFLAKNNGTLSGLPVDTESIVAKAVATKVDEETGITTIVPSDEVTEVTTSVYPVTRDAPTTLTGDVSTPSQDVSMLPASTTTPIPISSVTTTEGSTPGNLSQTTFASVQDVMTTAGEEVTTTSSTSDSSYTFLGLATTPDATSTAGQTAETTLPDTTTSSVTAPITTELSVPTSKATTVKLVESTTGVTTTSLPETVYVSTTTKESGETAVRTLSTESSGEASLTAGAMTTTQSETTIGVTSRETTTSGLTVERPLTTDLGTSAPFTATSAATAEATSTPSPSSETITEQTFSEPPGTVPSVIVFSAAPTTTVDNVTEPTLTTFTNVTATEATTTEMSPGYRYIDGDGMNGTDSSDLNATASTTMDPIFYTFTEPFNVTDSPSVNVTLVDADTDVPVTATMTAEANTTEAMNVTVTYPPFGNRSSIEDVDPGVNVSNRTFAMGRNLTFMNNNTLSEDGADVVNSTLDSWNMTAASTLLNAANFTFGDDNATTVATEGDNTTHVGTTGTQFDNQSMAMPTEDMIKQCSAEEFYCTADPTRTCLKTGFLCDQFEDCPGAQDEQNCTDTCGENFQCKDSSCVMFSAKCDGIRDCSGGEDEQNCEIVDSTCSDLEVMCPDSSACLKPLSLCDGIYNCRDRSDESGCVDKTLCEQSNKFYCGDKLCISAALRCDGHEDCKDGEDEVNCTCGENQFQCMNGFCVMPSSNGSVRCDGVADCADGSDERGCVKIDINGAAHAFDGNLGSWTLICADSATIDDGHRICQEMGYSKALSVRTLRVQANTTYWASWKHPRDDQGAANWSTGLHFTESCHNGALAIKCNYFECENQTEVLFRIEREATGQSTQNDVWPYLALLHGHSNESSCHGEIVSPLWILTSAYCLEQLPQNLSQVHVQVGFAHPASSREEHRVHHVVQHPHYSRFRSRTLPDYDLALVRLAEPLTFTNHIAAVCLPDDVARPGVTCFVGSLGHGKPRVPFRKASPIIHLPIVISELTTCNNEEHYKNDVSQKMICGDGRKMVRQLCDGDLGAPLMCLSPNNIWRLAGLLSYQRHCGIYEKHPSVFSNIYEMRDFIHNVTGLLSYNVTHDPQVYSLLEFPQADDGNASAAMRSYVAGKMAGLEHNSSATAAALYAHEDILGERRNNTTFTTLAPTAGSDDTTLDLEDIIPHHNRTIESTTLSVDEGSNVTMPMTTPMMHDDSVQARLQEIDSSDTELTTTNHTEVVTLATTIEPHGSMAALRLPDADPSKDTSNETASDASSVLHHDNVATTNDTKIDGRAVSDVLANSSVVIEMQSFREQNSAEDTTEQYLADNMTTLSAPTSTLAAISEDIILAITNDYARSLLKEQTLANESISTTGTSTPRDETTTVLIATSSQSGSTFAPTDNGTTLEPQSTSTVAPAKNHTMEKELVAHSKETTVLPSVDTNSKLEQITLSNDTSCTGFICNSDGLCIEEHSVCDGSYACSDGSDEMNCVQLRDNVVHGRKKGSSWMPACGDTWDDALSDSACKGMGFQKASQTSIIALESPYETSLRHINGSDKGAANVLKSLAVSNDTCNTMVTMKCHHYVCGAWNGTLAASSSNTTDLGLVVNEQSGYWPSIGVLSSADKRCTANFISEHWLLASASCISQSDAGLWAFSTHDSHNTSSASKHAVLDVLFNHGPNVSQEAGVALVRLKDGIKASEKARPICLPGTEATVGQNCLIAGLMLSGPGHDGHHDTQQVTLASLHVACASECSNNHTESGGNMLCAKRLESKAPLCQHEAEAALMCTNPSGTWELRGWLPAVSLHQLCSEPPGNSTMHAIGYTSVDPSIHWVLNVVGHGLVYGQV